MAHHRGAETDCDGHRGEHTPSRWKPGCRACRQKVHHGTHVWVGGPCACCPGAGGETQRTLASPVAHEEGTPQGCVGKCHTQGRRQSSLGLLAMLSGYRGVQEVVHPSNVGLGGEP